jgi:hypothetical protein
MFLRPNHRGKNGKNHTYWSLVETVRTPDGPCQKTLCYLGELNSSAQTRWLRSIEVFNEQGEAQQLKLFPADVEPPPDDPQVARVLLNKVRLERTREFGACYVGLELWKRLQLDRFFEQVVDDDPTDVPWSRVTALLAINRLCAPGSELAVEQRWYPRRRAEVTERARFTMGCSSCCRRPLRIRSSGRDNTVRYSAKIAVETYSRAGLVIASRRTVRCDPSGLIAAETTMFVSRTSRSGIISASFSLRAWP